jgi:hypothetical protein
VQQAPSGHYRNDVELKPDIDSVIQGYHRSPWCIQQKGELSFIIYLEECTMKQSKIFSAFILMIMTVFFLGCAATAKHEGTGEYVDDTVITTKVKAAILEEPTLKSCEINVETFKGIVQLSGFVGSKTDINKAVEITHRINGVKSVTNSMRLK